MEHSLHLGAAHFIAKIMPASLRKTSADENPASGGGGNDLDDNFDNEDEFECSIMEALRKVLRLV